MAKSPGVYICSGCGIGDALDTAQLAKVAESEFKVPRCQVHPFLCSPEGVALIRKDLDEGAVDGVVVAACSPRVKTDAFRFDPTLVLDRVNLREHVVWCQKPNDEDTQMMAEDYLRMGITKAQKSEPLEPVHDEISKKILVVGGGVTGLTAALEGATAGYEVVLVEQADRLGGFVSTLKKRFPTAPPYTELTVDGVAAQIESVSYHPKIQVLTKAKILKTSGQPGMFDVTVATEAGEMSTRVGSIVMATGWKPYDATKLGHLGYGLSPDVVTNVELERMVAAGPIARPSDGKAVQSVLFVQCAGSRDTDHLAYCSSVCCMASLKHAAYVHEQNPDAQVYIIYKDIRTPGQYERFYRAAQDHPLNFLTKGEVAGVEIAEGGTLAVTVKDSLVGETVRITVDLVVLATGMVPNAADGAAIRAVKDARATLARADASEPQKVDARKKIETLAHHEGTEILNLTYRQGPDLPAFRYGFPDSHFVCFPYETRRTGIYAAGHGPVPDGRRARAGGRRRRDAQGDPERGARGPGRGGASARRRPLVPVVLPPALHAVQALHRGVPVRHAGRGCEGHAPAQRVPLPPVRRLHGRLPRAHHLVQELLGRDDRLDDQGHRGARGGGREAARARLHVRERRLSGARRRGAQPRALRPERPGDSASLPGLAEHRLDRRRACRAASTASCSSAASTATTTSATSCRAASWPSAGWRT